MFPFSIDRLVDWLAAANQILTVGTGITAFSLLLYSLTFNLKDRVARSFSLMLAFITLIYFGDAVVTTTTSPPVAEPWLRFQWAGIAFVPAAYLQFSDALLATTGQPSRGRRRMAVRSAYLVSTVFLGLALRTEWVVTGGAVQARAAYLKAGPYFWVFTLYFIASAAISGWILWRAYRRGLTATTRRRMVYLMAGSVAPALGSFPVLLLSGPRALLHPVTFWSGVIASNALVAVLLSAMAYTVAFFGATQPDRVVKARLFQWLLRGPVVVSTSIAVFVLALRAEDALGTPGSHLPVIALVSTLLVLQFLINLVRIPMERWLFYGQDRQDVLRLQMLGERLLTRNDLGQFLESVLAAACEALRIPSAFIAEVGERGTELAVAVGPDDPMRQSELPPLLLPRGPETLPKIGEVFIWGTYWLLPLRGPGATEMVGLLGMSARSPRPDFSDEEWHLLHSLAEKAAAALGDRQLQREVFGSLARLMPEVDRIQRLRAAARFSGAEALTSNDHLPTNADLAQWVKDALSHYWGGPKLTDSPLMRLKIVESALREHDGNAANALRAVLRQAIERIKPEGERRFTVEWILYNILEMKFLQGRKVREVAARLAMSEADLYRKQRVAVDEVARVIGEMESETAAGEARVEVPAATLRG